MIWFTRACKATLRLALPLSGDANKVPITNFHKDVSVEANVRVKCVVHFALFYKVTLRSHLFYSVPDTGLPAVLPRASLQKSLESQEKFTRHEKNSDLKFLRLAVLLEMI